MVYFVKAGYGRGPIKIGQSQDPEKRLRQLRRKHPEPLHILAAIHGDIGVEQELHRRFQVGRIEGEWFAYETPGLHDFVSAALHFEGFWPDDRESPLILDVLDVLRAGGFECPVAPCFIYEDER